MRYISLCLHIFPSVPSTIFSSRAAIFLTSCISIFHFLHLVIYTEPALVWDSLSASAVICDVLPRQGIGFFPCYHALALQLAIHTRLPWPPAPVCVYLSGIYCFHLLTHPHPILQFTQPTWTIMWLSSLQSGDVPGCNMHGSLRWPTHSATYVSSQELGALTSDIYHLPSDCL